ncbi:MAG: hypothetical protein IJ660_03135 [Alphaproteobacteria bacterium]|nr:hypothetical protein [Alphaproteobacteria bacterium]
MEKEIDTLTTYNALYGNGRVESIHLGRLINRGGAAGRIFEVIGQEKVVAKIFHNLSNSNNNRQKLEAMLVNAPNFPPTVKDGIEYVQIAWPTALLEDEKGFCVGYLMPLINMDKAVSLDHLMQKSIRQKLGLSEKYSYRIFAAYNIASMVAALHQCGHYIVDLKPSNISVYRDTMIVAMVDCDGFSIQGEHGSRYPAEFVSEEYIYPEGMDLNCSEMGEEQDKFALAVIIFKLLNNGIHPFSGVPRKDTDMLTIQQRIEDYHYAYGSWLDKYQAPHPYSLHSYFDKKTLDMFDRAFVCGQERPTAKEWVEHLWSLLHNLKQCKQNPDHVYFTNKGCGLCAAEEKLTYQLNKIRKESEEPQKVRGMELSAISSEEVAKQKAEQVEENKKILYWAVAGIVAYLIFFAGLYYLLAPFHAAITSRGIGIQVIILLAVMTGIYHGLKYTAQHIQLLRYRSLFNMLFFYAIFCLLIIFVSLNHLSADIFSLTE